MISAFISITDSETYWNDRIKRWPCLCVDTVTDKVRLKESIIWRNYFTKGWDGQHTCIL